MTRQRTSQPVRRQVNMKAARQRTSQPVRRLLLIAMKSLRVQRTSQPVRRQAGSIPRKYLRVQRTSQPVRRHAGTEPMKRLEIMSNDTCAWTPNFIFWKLGQASLGKSRQVGGDRKSWNSGYWELGQASLGKSRQVGGDRKSWNSGYWELVQASLGKQAATAKPGFQRQFYQKASKNPTQLKLCLGKYLNFQIFIL